MGNRMRVATLLFVLVATAGVLAACGGSGKSTTNAGSTTPTGQTGFAAYTACLRKNGVTLPTGRPRGTRPTNRPTVRPTARPSGGFRGGGFFGNQPPAGVDPQTWQKAQQACASLRPTGGPGGFGGRNSGAMTAYRNCLSDHGVTMSAGPGGIDRGDPKVAAAMQACRALLPTGRPNPSPTA